MKHDPELIRAAAALGDGLASIAVNARLNEIEQALKFDECPERRRQMRREFLEITDKRETA